MLALLPDYKFLIAEPDWKLLLKRFQRRPRSRPVRSSRCRQFRQWRQRRRRRLLGSFCRCFRRQRRRQRSSRRRLGHRLLHTTALHNSKPSDILHADTPCACMLSTVPGLQHALESPAIWGLKSLHAEDFLRRHRRRIGSCVGGCICCAEGCLGRCIRLLRRSDLRCSRRRCRSASFRPLIA